MQIKKPQKMDYFKEREPVQDWEKNYIRELSRFRKALRKNRDKGGENTYDFTDAMSKRRNRAALALLPEILERYKNVLDDEIALGEAWRDLNLPFQTYSIIDAQSHMLLAAAIWILDQVVDQFEGGEPEEGFPEFWTGWRKIYCYLPTDEDQLDDLISCDVWDPQYDYDLIISVEYVLHCRDEEEKDGGGYPRVLTSDRLAAGKTDRETQGRKNFQAILNLIPQDAIDTAVSHFRTAYWQWLDRYFESVEPFLSTSISCENELLELQKQYNDLGTELGVIIDAGEKAAKEEKKKKKLPLAQPIPNFPFSSDFSLSDRPFERNMPGREHAQSAAVEIMATGLEVAAQLDSIADEVDELMDHVNDIRTFIRTDGTNPISGRSAHLQISCYTGI